MPAPLVGIFVGGHSKRFGGTAKGLLESPLGGTIVERLVRVTSDALGPASIVLVGNNSAYTALGFSMLEDDPRGIGPLGGLAALLAEAVRRNHGFSIALACDLPFVSAKLLKRLAESPSLADALAPHVDGRWQPLVARYRPAPALDAVRETIAAGERALHRVFARLGERAAVLELDDREIAELRDWDEPADRR
jgi:molybdopterin-guanine dinucleotide biosynthesis protein A